MAAIGEPELRTFATSGYIVIPDIAPEPLLREADLEIDELVATVPPHARQAQPGTWRSWFPPVARLPRCADLLLRSQGMAIAEQLVQPERLEHAFDHIQVAETEPGWKHVPGGPHIDGHGPGQDPPASFTMLAAVMLTDQTASGAGNLWVWPGSHLRHAACFRERGVRALIGSGGHVTSLTPPVPVGTPVEVKARRGDLLLAHFLLGHNKGGNTRDRVRRTVFYRLATPRHRENWNSTFVDPWSEYPAVAAALARRNSVTDSSTTRRDAGALPQRHD